MWSMEVAIQQFVEVLNVLVILLQKFHNISYHTTPARDFIPAEELQMMGQPVYCKCKCIPIPNTPDKYLNAIPYWAGGETIL